MSSSSTRIRVDGLVALVVGLLVALLAFGAAGCHATEPSSRPDPGPTSSAPTAASSPPAPFRPTYAYFVAALPRAHALPGWSPSERCVTSTDPCARSGPRKTGGHGAFASWAGGQRGRLREQLLTSVVAWPTVAVAAHWLAQRKSDLEDAYTGLFDRELQDNGDGTFDPGQRGIGRVTPLARGPWVGYLVTARLRYLLDGETSPPGVHTYAFLVRGRYGVIVQVDRWADRTGAARAGRTSQRVLGAVLERLDTAAAR